MWAYIIRKLLYNIPVYLGIILLVMLALRVRDPVKAFQGKNATYAQNDQMRTEFGLDKPFLIDWKFWGRKWTRADGGYGGSHLRKGAGIGRSSVVYRVDLDPGTYRIELTWPHDDAGDSLGSSERVWVFVRDGDRAFSDSSVRQEPLPKIVRPQQPGDAPGIAPEDEPLMVERSQDADGYWWYPLTGQFDIVSGNVQVRIIDDGEGVIIADAVRFIRQGQSGPAPPIVINSDDERVEIVNGDPWTVGGFVRSSWDNQYISFLKEVFTLNFEGRSWQNRRPVAERISSAIPPSLLITLPQIVVTALIAICVGLLSAFFRGRPLDKTLVLIAVLGMSISYLVYIIMGQYFGAHLLNQQIDGTLFELEGYDDRLSSVKFWTQNTFEAIDKWVAYCMLPVMIGIVVAMGYDTRFYRAVMVEESTKDYIITAKAKGVGRTRTMFVHMLKNAMIPIITRIMITLPFLITGSILAEQYFQIPGMGRELLTAVVNSDFPVVQAFTALFAAVFIVSVILTDVLYAVVDPRVRLS